MNKIISKKKICIFIIYLIALIFFNIHIEKYQIYVKEFPDEYSHIAYIAYLKQTKKIIPEFENMKETDKFKIYLTNYNMSEMLEEQKNSSNSLEIVNTNFLENSTNHLGHPPLYYHIMNFFNLVKVKDGNIIYNLKKLRDISQIISNIALIIVFIIAYKNLKTVTANFVFSIILVNIPLFPFVSGAVSNDVLSFLGLSVYLLGASNLVQKNYNYLTYFLLAIGTFICMMNKVTVGIILVISYLIIFTYLIVKEKNLNFILRKEFLATSPIYICIFLYYIFIIQKYGVIQPSIQVMNPEYYKTTGFYDGTIYTKAYSLKMYSKIYWNNFINYWAGYNYNGSFHQRLLKENIASLIIFIFPILYLIVQKIKRKKLDTVNISICIGVYIAIGIQFIKQFIEFKTLSRIFRRLSFKILCVCNAFIYIVN